MSKIPIHIITGFLGSGKTTLIKQILTHDNSYKTLVLINELGEVSLDNLLVQPINDNTYLLPSGCMCCTVLTDVKDTLLNMITVLKAGKLSFDKIIIETTGLANPASILSTLENDTHLKGLFDVYGMTCVIDGEMATNQADNPEWLSQILASHQLVLSKQDRIDDIQKSQVVNYINKINQNAHFVNPQELVDMAYLFDKSVSLPKHFFVPKDIITHGQVQTGVVEFSQAVDWHIFGIWMNLLLAQYGEQILRIKGMLYLQGVSYPILLHGVQHCLYPPEHLDTPLWYDKISRLVFITRGVEIEKIKNSAQLIVTN